MKLIILEGSDRTGKDTLINSLLEIHPDSKTVHWGFPQGTTNKKKTDYQKMSFEFFMKEFAFLDSRGQLDMLIWNRSHIGECVYGPLYRDSDPEWIYDLENDYLLKDNVFLVYLYGDTEFLLQNDDGNSFTTELEKKNHEAALFNQAIDKSAIKNKLKIKVNNGNSYINKSGIITTVRNFVNI